MITSESKTCAQSLGVFQMGRSVFCGHHVNEEGMFCAAHGPEAQGTGRPAYLDLVQNQVDTAQMELRWACGDQNPIYLQSGIGALVERRV